ncbi:MAG TPA: cell wall hydrolase [Steroidobacteraceae bacterium]|jgi:spore germination cell wall hydrolase CwlJ-like protein|nr:cell wall hydrolase [Steroidobacteraceae bacterium]
MRMSLFVEARFWPVMWRRRLLDSWRFRRHEHLGFVALLALLLLAVAGVIYLAYRDGTSIEPVRIETVQRDEARARQRADDLQCLAENIYFEARGEPLAGQYAVAEVTLNRTHARNFPRTICAVVHERRWDPVHRRHVADFSWTAQGPLSPEDGAAWKQAMTVANAAYDELSPSLVPEALFYHATSVQPDWARSRHAVATIGNHIFYR